MRDRFERRDVHPRETPFYGRLLKDEPYSVTQVHSGAGRVIKCQ